MANANIHERRAYVLSVLNQIKSTDDIKSLARQFDCAYSTILSDISTLSQPNECCIYTLSDNSGVRYVGQTNNPNMRFGQHLRNSTRGITQKDEWIRLLLEEDDRPQMNIIEWCSEDSVDDRERYWMNYYRSSGVNLLNGGRLNERQTRWSKTP